MQEARFDKKQDRANYSDMKLDRSTFKKQTFAETAEHQAIYSKMSASERGDSFKYLMQLSPRASPQADMVRAVGPGWIAPLPARTNQAFTPLALVLCPNGANYVSPGQSSGILKQGFLLF